MEKKDKGGWLKGDLGKVFRKYAFVGLAAAAMIGPMAGTAQAQNGTVANGVSVTQTMQQENLKPWANNPEYIERVNGYEEAAGRYLQTYNANMDAAIARLGARNMNTINRHIQTGKQRGSDGWQIMDVLQTGSEVNASQSTHQAYVTRYQNAKITMAIAMRDKVDKQVTYLDAVYAKQLLSQQQQAARTAQLQQRQQQSPAAGAVLTPQQQHDRLVRAYQDAQLRSAQSNGRIQAPTADQFGLDKNDPAIQVGGSTGGSTLNR